jgi:type I restriction enzyme M protein
VATVEEIAMQGFSLSIPLYVKRKMSVPTAARGEQPTLREAWEAWAVSERTSWTEMDAVVDLLDGLVGEEQERAEVTND